MSAASLLLFLPRDLPHLQLPSYSRRREQNRELLRSYCNVNYYKRMPSWAPRLISAAEGRSLSCARNGGAAAGWRGDRGEAYKILRSILGWGCQWGWGCPLDHGSRSATAGGARGTEAGVTSPAASAAELAEAASDASLAGESPLPSS